MLLSHVSFGWEFLTFPCNVTQLEHRQGGEEAPRAFRVEEKLCAEWTH